MYKNRVRGEDGRGERAKDREASIGQGPVGVDPATAR
jgi:hypothetical protein